MVEDGHPRLCCLSALLLMVTCALTLLTLPSPALAGVVTDQAAPATPPGITGQPPSATTPAAVAQPSAFPPLPLVHFTASDAPSLPEFKARDGDVDVIAMQAAVRLIDHPEDTPLQKAIRAAIIDFLVTRRDPVEPSWPDGLNPMVWIPRTLKGASEWWTALVKIPATQRPFFVGLPFLWASDEQAAKPNGPPLSGHPLSSHLNNEGLLALFGVGDTNAADDDLTRACTADHENPIPAFNSGVLQMALHNRLAAVRQMFVARDNTDDAILKQRIQAFAIATRALNLLLKDVNTGSQRRLFDEAVDTSWALTNSGNYDLAQYVAGQGVVLDPDEHRCEAALILAMCASKKNDPVGADKWLSEALGNYQKNDSGRPELLALVKQARAEIPEK